MDNVGTLRKAAAAMREQNDPGRGFVDDTLLAVADWLDWTADNGLQRNRSAALPVAKAYLGLS